MTKSKDLNVENRYILFVFELMYPGGGWHDFVGHFDTLTEAMSAASDAFEKHRGDYYQIVDKATNTTVAEGRSPPHRRQ